MIVEKPPVTLVDLQFQRPATGFVIGRGVLGRTLLAAAAGALQWQSVIGSASHISITRGSTVNGVSETAAVGTLSATFVNSINPMTNPDIKPNVPVSLRSKVSGAQLFTGFISDVNTVHQVNKATGTYTDFVTITAVDAVQTLANTTRYGATVDNQTFAQRLAALQTSTSVFLGYGVTTPYQLGSTVYEGSLAAHLDLLCNSTGAHWWVNNAGFVSTSRVQDGDTYSVSAEFTDFNYPTSPYFLHYTDIETAFDTRNMVNDLTLNQHDTQVNSDGETVADDNAFYFKANQSVADYGARSGSVDVSLWAATDLTNRANEILGDYSTPQFRVTRITWNVQENPSFIENLEIGHLIVIDFRNTRDVYRIVSLNHEITPERWITTFNVSKDR